MSYPDPATPYTDAMTAAIAFGAAATNADGGTVYARESLAGLVHKTTLTLAAFRVITGNTTGISFGSAKLYDFPEGRILILGCTSVMSTITFGADIASGGSGDYSIGSAATADGTLATTEVNILPSSPMLDPFVTRTGSAAGSALAASAQIDGTSTAVDAILNCIIDDADVSDGAASDPVDFTGTVTITWVNLGDY